MLKKPIDVHANDGIVAQNGETPTADVFTALADKVAVSLSADIASGNIAEIEAAGKLALAEMLRLYAEGKLPKKESFSFLKSLVDRKTPDAVQRVEQHTQFDMRVLLTDLLQNSENTKKSAIAYAQEQAALTAGRAGQPQSSNIPLPESEDSLNLPEPPKEIQNIRAGKPSYTEDEWKKWRV